MFKDDVYVSKIEQKDREVEESGGKGSDPKSKDAKAKDPKSAKGKGAEVEKKEKNILITCPLKSIRINCHINQAQ